MRLLASLLLYLVVCLSVFGAGSPEDAAYESLSKLEPQGFNIRLEEPHPWNPRDHDVWEIWISDEGNVRDLFAKAAPHLRALRKPIQISLKGHELAPPALEGLKDLANLRYLNLSDSSVTDRDMRKLDGIDSLWELDISDTFVTAEGLQYLDGCADLKDLQAYSLDLRGRAFETIRTFKSLGVLCVSGSLIDVDGWEHIASLEELKELRCSLTQLSDGGLESISKLGMLNTLIAYTAGVSDVGIQHIKKMQSLSFLFLDNNAISDASLGAFESLPNLKQLGLRKTKVSEKALFDLAAALPELYIISSHGPIGNEGNKDPVGEPFFRRVGEVKAQPGIAGSTLSMWMVIGSVLICVFAAAVLLRRLRGNKKNMPNKARLDNPLPRP